jgi:uncharacterized OsmC-like protein
MDAESLRNLQAPLKQAYRDNPSQARVVMMAQGVVDQQSLTCKVTSHSVAGPVAGHSVAGPIIAGLHPAAGGSGEEACSGDMLLQSLVACSGVTLAAVATAMAIEIRSAKITATGEMDFRGTLGLDRSVPIGIQSVKIDIQFNSDAEQSQLAKLVELTERYCVILQTLKHPPELKISFGASAPTA